MTVSEEIERAKEDMHSTSSEHETEENFDEKYHDSPSQLFKQQESPERSFKQQQSEPLLGQHEHVYDLEKKRQCQCSDDLSNKQSKRERLHSEQNESLPLYDCVQYAAQTGLVSSECDWSKLRDTIILLLKQVVVRSLPGQRLPHEKYSDLDDIEHIEHAQWNNESVSINGDKADGRNKNEECNSNGEGSSNAVESTEKDNTDRSNGKHSPSDNDSETLLVRVDQIANKLEEEFPRSPPYTIQRIAELAIEPEKYYSCPRKLLDAIEKIAAVTSSVDDLELVQRQQRQGQRNSFNTMSEETRSLETVAN